MPSLRPFLLPAAAVLLLVVVAVGVRILPTSLVAAPEKNQAVGSAVFFALFGAGLLALGLVAVRAYLAGDVRLPADFRHGVDVPAAVDAVAKAPDFPARLAASRKAVGSVLLSSSATYGPSPVPSLPSAPFLL